jgi:hypothetical protein
MVEGDFNGDGNLDLATTSINASTVSILLGNGDGTFQAHRDYAVGNLPYAMAAGDLNSDGKLDLVVGNAGDDTFSILLGNGDGTFQTRFDYPTVANPQSAVIADFNGDGKLDLAVFSEGDGTSILLGKGDGTFHRLVDYSTGCGPENAECTAAAADLNGDGKLDLVVRNNGNGPAVLLVLLGNGDGTFQSPSSFPTGSRPSQVVIGDFNGDGKLDLAVPNAWSDTVSVFLQTTGGPAVTLKPASVSFPVLRTVGTTSLEQKVKLTNTGNGELDVAGITVTGADPGDFAQSNNCTPTVAGGASCLITVTFTPTAQGVRTASVSITDNAPGSPQTVPLTGRGTFLKWAPRSMYMGEEPVGTSSPAYTVKVSNAGTAPISLYSITIGGVNPGDFTQTNTCGSSLNPGASCTIEVTFTPTAVGDRLEHVAIQDSAFGGTHRVGLLGKGT